MPTLVYRKSGRPNAFVFGVQDAPVRIGRGMDCRVIVDAADVSREHAEIYTADDGVNWFIRDLNSSNGTFVNDVRIEEHALHDQDVLVCGATHFEFRRGPTSGRFSARTERVRHHTPHAVTGVARAGEMTFEVYESSRWLQSPEDDVTDVDTAALQRRIVQLETHNRVLERELMRARDALSQYYASEEPTEISSVHVDDLEPPRATTRNAAVSSEHVFVDQRHWRRRSTSMMERISKILPNVRELEDKDRE